ncbi:MAG: UbiA family prenyltransferase [Spirulina sp.]
MMLKRWWIYQQERFPIFQHGMLILVFSSATVCYSALLRDRVPHSRSLLVAFISLFLFFLQLRIIDEFKDYDDDRRYRPYRPVPRGLIDLKELGIVGLLSAAVQLYLAYSLRADLAILLGFVWIYMLFMSQEFFIKSFLKTNPILYLISHNLIIPLICLYGTACDWLVLGESPPLEILWFLVASSSTGLVIEIGRKIRAPQDEEVGVETYSVLWGRDNAVLVWCFVILLSSITSYFAAEQIGFSRPFGFVLFVLGMGVSCIAYVFFNRPTRKGAKLIDTMSGLWTLSIYLSLGVVPFFLHYEVYRFLAG